MEYTPDERTLAKALDDETLALIDKVLNEKYAAEETSEANVLALSNERYGEIMKVNFMVRRHVHGAIARIKKLKTSTTGATTPAVAPK